MRLSNMARKLIIWVGVIVLVCVLVSVIYYRSWDFLPFLYGALLGTVASVLRILLLDRAVNRALTMKKQKAGGYIGLQNLLRLAIAGVALVIGAIWEPLNLWGVVAGILAMQLSIYLLKYSHKEAR